MFLLSHKSVHNTQQWLFKVCNTRNDEKDLYPYKRYQSFTQRTAKPPLFVIDQNIKCFNIVSDSSPVCLCCIETGGSPVQCNPPGIENVPMLVRKPLGKLVKPLLFVAPVFGLSQCKVPVSLRGPPETVKPPKNYLMLRIHLALEYASQAVPGLLGQLQHTSYTACHRLFH